MKSLIWFLKVGQTSSSVIMVRRGRLTYFKKKHLIFRVVHSNSKEVFAFYTRGTDYSNNKLTDMDIDYQTSDDDWNPTPYNIDDSVQLSGDVTYRAFGTPRIAYESSEKGLSIQYRRNNIS